uniref:Uncharacterized protein n=1 Tax=Tanacetum cinerariifolium TaxID=118510 RepID=A0A6L2J1P6_TANCI|nr:hypothetical protein [Tanacetum cinerariifolium]
MINLHIICDDSLLGTLKFVSKTQDCQQYGALIPDDMINQDVKYSKAYKTYYDFATEEATPKKARKFKKKSTIVAKTCVAIRDTPSESVLKKKTPAKVNRGKCMGLLYDVALLKTAQLKKTLKKRKLETYKLHASGSGDGVGSLPKGPNAQEHKNTGTEEGTDSDDDDSDEVTKDDDDEDDVESDADDDIKEFYKDVNVRSTDTKHKKQGKEDKEMKDAGRDDTQQTKYEQVKYDEHVTLKTVHDTQKTKGPVQSSSVSSDFANQFLNLDNVPPTDTKVVSLMNVKFRHEEPNTHNPPLLNIPITVISKIVSALEKELSQLKQADYSAQLLKMIKSQIPAMVDAQISIRLKDSIKKSFRSYIAEFEKAKDERKRYIYLVGKYVKEIIKDEVKSQLPQILPKETSDFSTPIIQRIINESVENAVLAKSSFQPESTHNAASSLNEFKLNKILLDKLEKSKSYRAAEQHKDLYDALVKSYQLDKDLFDSYGKAYSLKRVREDKDKDEDPPARSDQWLKKGRREWTLNLQKALNQKSLNTEMLQDQGGDLGNTKDQPNVEEASKHDLFKKPERPLTLDRDWNAGKQIDFRPPQTWISKIAKAGKPPLTFDEMMSTPIDFLAYPLNSQLELEYHFEECYKTVTDKLNWMNPEGHEYPFDLSKPLLLIQDQGRQVVPTNYFFNNDLKHLKGGSLSNKYTTSIIKTKAANIIEGIEDMVPSLVMDYFLKRRWSKLDRKRSRIMIKAIDQQLFKRRDYGMAGDDYKGPPVIDNDQYEEESIPVYDTDIEDVIEEEERFSEKGGFGVEEEGFVGKGGFGGKEDNIEDVVVVPNDLCSSMIQTTSNVDFEEDINTKSHELIVGIKRLLSAIEVTTAGYGFYCW